MSTWKMSFIEGNSALCQHSLLRYWSMPEVVFSVWCHEVTAVIKWDVIRWHMPVIPALEKWRQEEQDFKTSFEASLGYVSYCLGERTNKQRPRRFHSETMWPVHHQATVLKARAEGGAASVFRSPWIWLPDLQPLGGKMKDGSPTLR